MTREEILTFINLNPLFFLATTEEEAPRVRGIMTFRADDEGIVFSTAHAKALCRQIEADPRVELCYYSPQTNEQFRIRGVVEPLEDLEVKEEIVEKFPFLKPWIDVEGYAAMAVFRLSSGEVARWTLETAFFPTRWTPF